MRALGPFSPVISTVLPRWAYLAATASRAATAEASQMWAALRSMTTVSGSVAYANRPTRSLDDAKNSSPVTE